MSLEVEKSYQNALWVQSDDSSALKALQGGLSKRLKLHCCQNLEAAATYLTQVYPDIVFYVLSPGERSNIASLDEWLQKSLPHAALVLVCKEFTNEDICYLSRVSSVSAFLDSRLSLQQVQVALERVFEVARLNKKRTRTVESLKVQNKQLETMNKSLEKIVGERTQDIQEKKNQIEAKVNKVKALLSFIKDLSRVTEIGDLSRLLQSEVKSLVKNGEPYLAFLAKDFGRWIYTIHQGRLIEKSVVDGWKSGSRLRINDPDDQKYLANQFSKPVQRTIALPLSSNHHQTADVLLFIEHNLDGPEIDIFIDEMGKRVQSLGLCLDRALLEIELKRSAYLWESTFDNIDEPIVIVNRDLKVLRENKSFDQHLKSWFEGHSREKNSQIQKCFDGVSQGGSELNLDGRFYDWKTYPIMDSTGNNVESVVSLFVDTTDEKSLQSKLIQHEKMTAIGHLAGNIAHELNNPLAGLKSLSQVIMDDLPEGDALLSDLNEIQLAADRSSKIIKDLLDFSSSKEEMELTTIDLNHLVEKTLPLLKSVTSNFRRNVKLNENPLNVTVSPQLIQQVLFNLVNNASQAMGDTGTLTIETREHRGLAQIMVADTGGGISSEVGERIFDPFFSTKKSSGGTGLGLSMSRNIVRSYGGEIHFESQVGEGTTFFLELPLVLNGT